MTLDTNATPAIPPAPKLQRTEVEWNHWAHVVPPSIDWREACRREYWGRNYERLRPGDTVTIHSSDHRIRFAMLVMNVNTAADPVHLDATFRPIFPPDLVLPQFPPQRAPRYESRLAHGGNGWNVLDLRTGAYLRENPLPRDLADNLAANMERAAGQTAVEAEALVGEFLQQRQPARTPRPPGTEGDLHIHPIGAGAWEVHGEGCAVVVSGLDSEESAQAVRAALSAPEPLAQMGDVVPDVVRVAALRPRPKSRPRGRPRKPAPRPAADAPAPMAAAAAEDAR